MKWSSLRKAVCVSKFFFFPLSTAGQIFRDLLKAVFFFQVYFFLFSDHRGHFNITMPHFSSNSELPFHSCSAPWNNAVHRQRTRVIFSQRVGIQSVLHVVILLSSVDVQHAPKTRLNFARWETADNAAGALWFSLLDLRHPFSQTPVKMHVRCRNQSSITSPLVFPHERKQEQKREVAFNFDPY